MDRPLEFERLTHVPIPAACRDNAFRTVACGLIALAAAAAYSDSLRAPFVFDDGTAIATNASIRHLATALHPPGGGATVTGRPFLNLSFALNYAVGGTSVEGYHLANLAIHILAGLTLFGLVWRTLEIVASWNAPKEPRLFLTEPRLLAFWAALLWTVHPLQTESVTYVVQRAESLMGLCFLVTLYGFVRYASGKPRAALWASVSVAACFVGTGIKEVIVTAPVIALLYDATFLSGTIFGAISLRKRYYGALFSSWILLGWLVVSAKNRGGSAGFGIGISWPHYVATQFPAVLAYLKLSIWPSPLVFDYGTRWTQDPWANIPCAIAVLVLVCASAWGLLSSKDGEPRRVIRALGFSGVWFFGILSVTSLIPGARQTMADHRMYLSLAPVMVLLVLGIDRMARRGLGRWGGALLCLVAAVTFAFGTFLRNRDYRTALVLWADTVAKAPDNPWAHNELGYSLLQGGQAQEAEAQYREALRINPDRPEVHNNLAMELAAIPGRMPEAFAEYEAALRLKPDFAEARSNFASALARFPGRLPEALRQFEEALKISPDFAEAHNNYALVLAKIPGRLPDAVSQYEEAIRLRPDFAGAHNNLATALSRLPGKLPEALQEFHEALRLDPGFAEAHNNRGAALVNVPGRQSEAIGEYEAALALRPNYPEAELNLANALSGIPNRLPEAMTHFEAALRERPGFPQAQTAVTATLARYEEALRDSPGDAGAQANLAAAYEIAGQIDAALRHWEIALKLDPSLAGGPEALKRLQRLQK